MKTETESKATPGPWTVKMAVKARGTESGDFAIIGGNAIIAEAFFQTSKNTFQPAEANAILIASAPRLAAENAALREALEGAMLAMRAPFDDWKGVLERNALDKGRAALAQGKGEKI